jgi:glycerol-3-phosphate acyltransferase PlsY
MVAVINILLAYLLGSVSGSILLGRLKKVDIRTMGSGNAGGTNALRTQGFWFALAVVLIDVGKGVLATAVIPGLNITGLSVVPVPEKLVLACGLAAVLGHCYPVWHGFRGGKGAATCLGVLAVVNPWLLIPMLSTWVVTLVLSGYVGLATVLAGFSLIPAAWYLGLSGDLITFVTILALFMAFTHRGNFRNMARGEEHRAERVRIINWFR